MKGVSKSGFYFGKKYRSAWARNHAQRAGRISKAFVKSGSRGFTIKGVRGFFKKRPTVS